MWRAEISYVCSIVAQRPADGDLVCGSAWCRCTGTNQASMIAWLPGLQYIYVLAVQRSLTVVRLSQGFHDSMCEYRVIFAIFSTEVANGTCTETRSRRGENGTRRRQQCGCSRPINTSPKKCGKTSCYVHKCVGKCLDCSNFRSKTVKWRGHRRSAIFRIFFDEIT